MHFAAIQEVRAVVKDRPETASGTIGGALAGNRVTIERCTPGAAEPAPIGVFRTQTAGWPSVTESDVKRLRARSHGAREAIVLVIRTLAQRPWSATLFLVDPKRPSTAESPLIEFPFDEYLLRNGWLIDLAPPAPHAEQLAAAARPRRSTPWVAAAAAVALMGGLTAIYESRWGRGAATAEVAAIPQAPPIVTAPIGLGATRKADDLELSWNGRSGLVRAASGGTLVIENGPVTRTIPVSAAQLQHGSVVYRPVSGVGVNFRLDLKMPDGRIESESLQVLGLDDAPSTAPIPTALAAAQPPRKAAPERTSVARADRVDNPAATKPPPPSNAEPEPVRRVSPQPSPDVAEELRQASGPVTISVLVRIDATGRVEAAKIVGATGEPESGSTHIRLAALNAAREWRFRPAMTDGHPVPSTQTLAIAF